MNNPAFRRVTAIGRRSVGPELPAEGEEPVGIGNASGRTGLFGCASFHIRHGLFRNLNIPGKQWAAKVMLSEVGTQMPILADSFVQTMPLRFRGEGTDELISQIGVKRDAPTPLSSEASRKAMAEISKRG